ncbi:hypothetical protein COV20_01755 [Candidatus Woesearchaeota archaeon CG10_big_fil_rev_8_21_14_0_10_45_16]|nr:MAG: hypothetical protein COV20_01755 [Candidatus Woesearchaeota archaeon CG10_big_fil_rev_8_21_14_0_10_45_16]
MNIVKLGGSIVNPNGKYDDAAIKGFIDVVKKSKEQFIFVVGGGKICRLIQDCSQKHLATALPSTLVDEARDWLGIAVTHINASYVREQFEHALGQEVYPEIILDPTQKLKSKAKVFIASGWKPGCSTDHDMMLLAETFSASKVFKITNFPYVKNVSPVELAESSEKEMKKRLEAAASLESLKWQELRNLVGEDWLPGLNTPFDPSAVEVGLNNKRIALYIGLKEEFFKAVQGKQFKGTVVSG